jgi:hypothetical protein
MPDVVAHGRKAANARACALCQLTSGGGQPESALLAGLPVGYIMRSLPVWRPGGPKWFSGDSPATGSDTIAAFRDGLAKPGWVETQVIRMGPMARKSIPCGEAPPLEAASKTRCL